MKTLAAALALTLAVSSAQARSIQRFHCGKHEILLLFPKYFSPNREHCYGGPCDGKEHYFAVNQTATSAAC